MDRRKSGRLYRILLQAGAIKTNLLLSSTLYSTEMPRLSENQRNQAIGMLQAGAMVNDVAQHFGCSRQTMHNLNTRFAITGSVSDHPCPGQRCVMSQQDDSYITLTHLRNRFLPATATAWQLRVNAQTIWNCLRQNNIPIQLFKLIDRTLVRFSLPTTGPLGCSRLNVTCTGSIVSGITWFSLMKCGSA